MTKEQKNYSAQQSAAHQSEALLNGSTPYNDRSYRLGCPLLRSIANEAWESMTTQDQRSFIYDCQASPEYTSF
jgi:hypothetical protein